MTRILEQKNFNNSIIFQTLKTLNFSVLQNVSVPVITILSCHLQETGISQNRQEFSGTKKMVS
jgi:hypothetical protein